VSAALKYDDKKPRLDLLPSGPLVEIAKVLTYGAKKYATENKSGEHNWRNGFAWSRLYGASLRHLLAHKDGESLDPESGVSHLAHAVCNLLFLLEHELKGLGTDDRYKGTKL